jgi:PAS domain S-box-containing protein
LQGRIGARLAANSRERMTMDDPAFRGSVSGKAAPARRKRSVWRLWGFLAAVLLLPAAILGTGAWGAWHLTWTVTERDLMRSAEINADYVKRTIASLSRTAERLTGDAGRIEAAPSAEPGAVLRRRILDMVRELPLVRAVVVIGATGRQLLHVDARLAVGPSADPAGGDIEEELARTPPGQVALGRAYRSDGDMLLALAWRNAPDGPAVIFVLDAAELGIALARHTDAPSDSAALIRDDGQILARYPHINQPLPPFGPERPLMQQLDAGAHCGNLLGATPLDGHPVAVAFCRVDTIPRLVVAVGRPRATILERWRQVMMPLLLVGVPAVFALIGLALVVRRQQDALETTLDGLEQRVAERTNSLREGEERLRLAVDAGQLGTWETELSTSQSTRSPRAIAILGFQPDIPTTPVDDWASRIHPGDRRRVLDAWDRLVTGRQAVYHVEYRFLRADGAWRWLDSTGAVVRTDPETGRPLRLAGTLQDITDRHAAEERRELLTQEVNHRARNALAIVQAILRLTHAANPAEFIRLVEGRIAALARAQSLLAAERWSGVPLATLIVEELAPFGTIDVAGNDEGGRFRLSGPDFRIRSEAVQPLGMVVHELATNAVKHGALTVPEGHVAVSWAVDEAAGLLRIRWTETDGPPPGFPAHRGVGSRVIETTVTGQLGGAVDRRWPEEGLTCDIALPLAKARAGPA